MSLGFVSETDMAGFDVVADHGANTRPGVSATNQVESAILTEVTSGEVVMMLLEYAELQVKRIGNVNSVEKAEVRRLIYRPMRILSPN